MNDNEHDEWHSEQKKYVKTKMKQTATKTLSNINLLQGVTKLPKQSRANGKASRRVYDDGVYVYWLNCVI